MDTKELFFKHEKLHNEYAKDKSVDIFIEHLKLIKEFNNNNVKHILKSDNELDEKTNDSMDLVSALKEAWNPDVLFKEMKSFFNTDIKNISTLEMAVPSTKRGLFLNSLNQTEKQFDLISIKNFSYDGDKEKSPIYNSFEIGRKKSGNFLVDGYKFFKKDDTLMMLHTEPAFGGVIILTAFAVDENIVSKFCNDVKKHMEENNFLKNEKISLSGKFIDRTTKDWDDVVLLDDVSESLEQLEKFFEFIKNEDFSQRGFIFAGPPGTGKTLSANILAEKIKGSFIWISEKDFIEEGYPRYTINQAFELAKELSPSVLFFEDVDSILLGNIDIFKTQLDGLEKHSGLMVILCTNYPDRFPDELLNRPGRFDEIVLFDLPDADARKKLIKIYLKGVIEDSDLDEIAEKTNKFSGAHIQELGRQAHIISKLKDKKIDKSVILEAIGRMLKQDALINSIRKSKES